MTKTISLSECAAFLRGRDTLYILTHKRPDGDTLGSAAALCHALRRLGKTAFVLPNAQLTETYEPFLRPYLCDDFPAGGTIVSVDVATERLFPDGFLGGVELAIDHHPTNSGFAALTCCNGDKASCGEIILELLDGLCGGPDREEAELLYIAVSTDTGCFVYANVTAETHEAAARLICAGADIRPLNKLFFRTVSHSRILLESYIYGAMRRYRDGEINVALVTLDMIARAGATESDCEDLAGLPGRIAGSRVSVTLREMADGECKISVRSGEDFDSSAVCALFGGGGHKLASGCSIYAPLEDACARIVRAIDERLS